MFLHADCGCFPVHLCQMLRRHWATLVTWQSMYVGDQPRESSPCQCSLHQFLGFKYHLFALLCRKNWPILTEDVAIQSAVAGDYSSPQFLLIPYTLLDVHQVEGLEPLVLRAVEATAATPDLQGMHLSNSMCWTLFEYKVVGGLIEWIVSSFDSKPLSCD